jgi:hypothetical protein
MPSRRLSDRPVGERNLIPSRVGFASGPEFFIPGTCADDLSGGDQEIGYHHFYYGVFTLVAAMSAVCIVHMLGGNRMMTAVLEFRRCLDWPHFIRSIWCRAR